jgi:mRNA interferase HigB
MLEDMRVLARGTLNGFVNKRVSRNSQKLVKAHLDAWYAEAAAATWANSAELKQHYRSASILNSERVVFNIKGNEYRLVVAINYHYQLVLIKWLGTHHEYDGIDALKVEYDKQRYSGSSDSESE